MNLLEGTCKKGDLDSCQLAGSHFIAQGNKDRDPKKAEIYFTKSCMLNQPNACYNLAVMYKNGDVGIEKNEEKF